MFQHVTLPLPRGVCCQHSGSYLCDTISINKCWTRWRQCWGVTVTSLRCQYASLESNVARIAYGQSELCHVLIAACHRITNISASRDVKHQIQACPHWPACDTLTQWPIYWHFVYHGLQINTVQTILFCSITSIIMFMGPSCMLRPTCLSLNNVSYLYSDQ